MCVWLLLQLSILLYTIVYIPARVAIARVIVCKCNDLDRQTDNVYIQCVLFDVQGRMYEAYGDKSIVANMKEFGNGVLHRLNYLLLWWYFCSFLSLFSSRRTKNTSYLLTNKCMRNYAHTYISGATGYWLVSTITEVKQCWAWLVLGWDVLIRYSC